MRGRRLGVRNSGGNPFPSGGKFPPFPLSPPAHTFTLSLSLCSQFVTVSARMECSTGWVGQGLHRTSPSPCETLPSPRTPPRRATLLTQSTGRPVSRRSPPCAAGQPAHSSAPSAPTAPTPWRPGAQSLPPLLSLSPSPSPSPSPSRPSPNLPSPSLPPGSDRPPRRPCPA